MSDFNHSIMMQGSPPNYSSMYPGIVSATQTDEGQQSELLQFMKETINNLQELLRSCSNDNYKEMEGFRKTLTNKIDTLQQELENEKRKSKLDGQLLKATTSEVENMKKISDRLEVLNREQSELKSLLTQQGEALGNCTEEDFTNFDGRWLVLQSRLECQLMI